MRWKNGDYYRLRIKAEKNHRTGKDVDRVFRLDLNQFRFQKEYGFGITLYEAAEMEANLTKASKRTFEACNQDESYRSGDEF